MKYCPLCRSEFRADVRVCANCSAQLVASLDDSDVRNNPPRLLWIGADQQEFDLVVSALTDAGIPAHAEEHLGGIIGTLLKAESKVYVLQADVARALETASAAIAAQRGTGTTMKCHACGADTSASLTACANCRAILYVEPAAETADTGGSQTVERPAMKYCPLCDAEYTAGHSRCTVCGVELVPEELRGRPLDEQQRNEKIVIIWRGGDPLAVSEVINRLREAGIRHHVHATNDHLVFELGMPRPKYAVRVFVSDAPRAAQLVAEIRESLPFGLSFEPPPEEKAAPLPERSLHYWNRAAATTEIWTGEDTSLAQLLEACLRENRIGVRREGREPGTLHLFVMLSDEAAAREIIREVREATPPA